MAVVGAGMSGLACALELERAGRPFIVLEARGRAGGVVGTLERDGYRFETGPNTVPGTAHAFLALCDELGLAGRLLRSAPEARVRYLFHRGRLRRLPSGPASLLATDVLSLRGRLRLLQEPFRRHRRVGADEPEPTFEAFLTERLGREAARRIAGAFVRGVYAAEIDELGARSAFPRLWSLANEHGGLVRGLLAARRTRGARTPAPDGAPRRSDLLSFPGGLAELADALAARLGARLRTGAAVEGLEPAAESGYELVLAGGERLRAAEVVLALPARPAAALLQPLDEALARDLGAVTHAAVSVVHLGLEDDPLPPGFGFLVPPDEPRTPDLPRVLGTLFVSNLFPGRAPRGAAAVTSFYRSADVVGLDERALVERAREDLARALRGPLPAVRVSAVLSWSDVIPRYAAGHDRRVEAIEGALASRLPGLVLAGNWVGGVSVDQCLAHGREVGRAIALAAPAEGRL